MDEVALEFGRKLKEIRLAKGLGQKEMGELLNVSRSHCSGMERGTNRIYVAHIAILVSHLKVSPNWLFKDEGETFDDDTMTVETIKTNQTALYNSLLKELEMLKEKVLTFKPD